jgi:hypothetical protein
VRVHAGDTLTVLADALDAAGRVLPRRLVVWASADQAVATATTSGTVTGMRTGQTRLIASREGQTTTVQVTVPIKGVSRWVVGERLSVVGQGGPVYGGVTGVLPREGRPTAFTVWGNQECRLEGGAWGCATLQSGTTAFNGSGFFPLRQDAAWLSGSGRVAKYVDGTLQIIQTGNNATYDAVWGDDGNHVVAVGPQGAIAQYDGTRWTRIEPREGVGHLQGVWGSSPTNVHVVGDSGLVMRWDGPAGRGRARGSPGPTRAPRSRRSGAPTPPTSTRPARGR